MKNFLCFDLIFSYWFCSKTINDKILLNLESKLIRLQIPPIGFKLRFHPDHRALHLRAWSPTEG